MEANTKACSNGTSINSNSSNNTSGGIGGNGNGMGNALNNIAYDPNNNNDTNASAGPSSGAANTNANVVRTPKRKYASQSQQHQQQQQSSGQQHSTNLLSSNYYTPINNHSPNSTGDNNNNDGNGSKPCNVNKQQFGSGQYNNDNSDNGNNNDNGVSFTVTVGSHDADSSTHLLDEPLSSPTLLPKTDSKDGTIIDHRPRASSSSLISRTTILSLPDVITESLLSWLTARDTSRCARVGRVWHRIALSDSVWRTIVLANWSLSTANSVRISGAPSAPRTKLLPIPPLLPQTPLLSPTHRSLSYGASSSGDTSSGITNGITADWRSRYRELMRIARNWKTGKCVESLLVGHSARVNAVSCGADIVVSCSEDQTIRVWHSPSKTCLQTLRGHTAPVTDVRFDGKEVVSASQDGSVRVWSIATGEQIRDMHSSEHRSSLLHVAGDITVGWTDCIRRLKCNAARIVVGGFQGQLLMWNRNTGVPLRALLTPYPPVYTHAPSPLQGIPLPSTFNIAASVATDRPPIECIDMEGEYLAVGAHDAVFIWDMTILLHALPTDEPLSAMIKSSSSHSDLSAAMSSGSRRGDSSSSTSICSGNTGDGLLLTLWHPGVRTVRLLRASLKRVVTLGGTHVHVFCLMSGQLLQSMLIRNHGFIHQHVPLPSLTVSAVIALMPHTTHDRSVVAKIVANWAVATFDRFVLETPDADADSADLSHVRVWRAFGPGLTEGEALKILVSRHHAKCSNAEVLVVADRRDGILTLRDYVPMNPATPGDGSTSSDGTIVGAVAHGSNSAVHTMFQCLKLCRCNIL